MLSVLLQAMVRHGGHTSEARSVLRACSLIGFCVAAPLMKERVLLLPLIGDEKYCDGLSEVQFVILRYGMVT